MKKGLLSLLCLGVLLTCSSCFKRDDFEDAKIYTTIYPISYATERLYGNNSTVLSIYPNGVDTKQYSLTNKQIRDYSKANLFIYNGLSTEKTIARDLLNKNKNMKIIDVSQGITVNRDIEELWINPTNYLMLCQNIKNNLNEFITNKYIIKEINDNYDELKIDISEIDAELKRIAENGTYNYIVASNIAFSFLNKYGFEVLVLDENEGIDQTVLSKVKDLISDGKINYIFSLSNEVTNQTVNSLIDNKKVYPTKWETIATLSDEQETNKDNYLTIMKSNIEQIKTECYE